jgi:hypothetical protein
MQPQTYLKGLILILILIICQIFNNFWTHFFRKFPQKKICRTQNCRFSEAFIPCSTMVNDVYSTEYRGFESPERLIKLN